MPPRLDEDLAGLFRLPAFRAYMVSRGIGGGAMTMLQAVIAWQVYAITGSALHLGLIGVMRFVPALFASLVGGAVADAYDRRVVVVASQVVPLLSMAAVLLAMGAGEPPIALIYAVVFVTGLALAFEQPARQALLPTIVPRESFAKAITVNATVQALSFVVGPTIAGGVIHVWGIGPAYLANIVLLVVSIVPLVWVHGTYGDPGRRAVSVAAIREGIAFVWSRPVLLGAMSLDMFAVIVGGIRALLPIYAEDILQVGAAGYGILNASLQVGAFAMSLALIVLPTVRQTGRVLLLSVVAFGLATAVFGLSRSFALSILAYMVVGAADQVSVVMRQTTIQLSTPDMLRGRVTAVNQVFISASNQLSIGAFVAAVTSATFAVVSGGLGCVAVVAFIAWRVPSLRRYRTDEAIVVEASPPPPVAPASGASP